MAGEPKTKKSFLSRIFDFDVNLSKDRLRGTIWLILFLTGLVVVYIANIYWAERTLLRMTTLTRDIKDLRAEYLTRQAEYMNKTRLSEISKITEQTGLKELKEPQKKVTVKEGEY